MIKSILFEEINKDDFKKVSIRDLRHLFPNKYLPVRPYNKQIKQKDNNGGDIGFKNK